MHVQRKLSQRRPRVVGAAAVGACARRAVRHDAAPGREGAGSLSGEARGEGEIVSCFFFRDF